MDNEVIFKAKVSLYGNRQLAEKLLRPVGGGHPQSPPLTPPLK